MKILIDTNILTRLASSDRQKADEAAKAIELLITRGAVIQIVPQNLYEFWSVATRPAANNGLGMSGAQAKAILDDCRKAALYLPDDDRITREWEALVQQFDVKGKNSHDTRLVAAMHVHGIDALLTFNTRDFTRYGVQLLEPSKVVALTQ